MPSSRIESITSSIVPRTEPRATTTVSASSQRYSRTSPPDWRPNRCSKSAAMPGISSSASTCLACIRYLTSENASGPTIAPIVTGSSGSRTWRGTNGGR